jgi:hypothetical protein
MANKWTEEEIKFIKDNYLAMSDNEISNYLGTHSKNSVETKRKRLGLLYPNNNRKYNFQTVLDEFAKTDYILLSDENDYKDAATNSLKYMCPRHMDKGVLTISLGHLQSGRGCYYCGRERAVKSRMIPLDKNKDKELCESHDFEYINTVRKNGKINIEFICNKHRELGNQYMTKYNMERNINGCKYCCGKELPEWYVLNKAKEINPNIELLQQE